MVGSPPTPVLPPFGCGLPGEEAVHVACADGGAELQVRGGGAALRPGALRHPGGSGCGGRLDGARGEGGMG